ncbi:MAG: citrate synthase [Deltaproteobacteria bacterium]|nr:citrate synthase [Deltaproteobacteria bacterium]MCX7952254.1 citrate synthase [Deltaproteobacteria bacterium]
METKILYTDVKLPESPSVVKISINDKEFIAPVLVGTEGEKALDIRELRKQTGFITYDPGFANTGSCKSAITFIDEEGILRYRGIPIEDLAGKATFLEVAFLLLNSKLPTENELREFELGILRRMALHEDLKNQFHVYPRDAHPMSILASMVASLAAFYPEKPSGNDESEDYKNYLRLIAKFPTIAAYSFKKSIGHPFIYPRQDYGYCENFLYMMFSHPSCNYEILPEVVEALELLFILHADHEQNCSTSTARLVRSSQANIFAAVTAAICALWGPRHGGANEAVISMLSFIRDNKIPVKNFVERVKNKEFRLMGFGHRVYKSYDPRAKIIKDACHRLLKKLNKEDELLSIALELEEAALHDEYFIERKLYPNVDFYSGIMYRAMGIPTKAFTVMFALGRLPGWLAHIREFDKDPDNKIGRPRQIYVGSNVTSYTPLSER